MIPDGWTQAVDFSHTPDPNDEFLDAVLGDGEGFVAVSFGPVPTTPTFYRWPSGKDRLLADVERRQGKDNVFFCPALRANEGALKLPDNCADDETPSLPVEPMPCLWADVDLIAKDGRSKVVNIELLNALGGIQVRSGTPGHVHWYGPLTEGVGLDDFNRLNTAVKNALGADAKQSNVSWLRWPTSINHKPTAQRRVMLPGDLTNVRAKVDDLEALIVSHASKKAPMKRRQGTRARGRQRATEAGTIALLDRYANVERGERNEAFHHIVRTAAEEGMSPDVVERLLMGHAAAGRFEQQGRLQVEVERSWPDADAEPEYVAVTFSDVQERKVEWLWYGWLPEGKIVMMDGDPGVSKSTLALTIAAHITAGLDWPDGRPCPKGDVIVLSAEDDPDDTMKPRLRLAGAKFDRVHLLTEVRENGRSRPPTLGDIGPLRRMIEDHSAKLVIVDVFMSYVPGKADSHKDQDVRAFLFKVKELASETGCAFLMLRHLNKSGGTNAKHRGGGSIGITGQARAVWTVGEDPNRPGVRVLSAAKVNNAPRPPSIAYELDFDEESETGRIRWAGLSELSADDLVTEQTTKTAAPRRNEAEVALLGLLTDAGGSMPSAELNEAMEAAGFSKATTHRAAVKLDVRREKGKSMDGRWTSYLPNVSTSRGVWNVKSSESSQPSMFS